MIKPLNRSLSLVLSLFAGLLLPCGEAAAANFRKLFIVENPPVLAPIRAAGLAETWQDPPRQGATVPLTAREAPNFGYFHASRNTGRDRINGGFPIRPTGTSVDPIPPLGPPLIPGGFSGLAVAEDDRVNYATVRIDVGQRLPVGPVVTIHGLAPGPRTRRLVAPSQTVIEGTATAATVGALNSANAHGAVSVGARSAFRVTDKSGPIPQVDVYNKNIMQGGRRELPNQGENLDPVFLTVRDVDTGMEVSEAVMRQTLEYANALFSLDEDGIRLTVARFDLTSFVDLQFSSESSWVLEPYTYGARLDASGLTAYGITPRSGWTVTTTADSVEAFFPFADGLPFDHVRVRPPSSLFTDGHTYTYDLGASNGAFELAGSLGGVVPEPTALALFAVGGLALVGHALRRSRQR